MAEIPISNVLPIVFVVLLTFIDTDERTFRSDPRMIEYARLVVDVIHVWTDRLEAMSIASINTASAGLDAYEKHQNGSAAPITIHFGTEL